MSAARDSNYDLIAIGGGFAGLATVARASQLGLKAAVFERSTEQRHICSSRYSTGVFSILGTDPTAEEDQVYSIIMSATDNTAQPEICPVVRVQCGARLSLAH
jgi:flavin-dependent dehydrogenase